MTAGDFQRLATTILAEPAIQAVLGPTSLAVLLDAAGERVLWSSPSDGSLLDRLVDRTGRAGVDGAAGLALAGIAATAPYAGLRTDRIRLGGVEPGPTLAVSSRRIPAEDGDLLFAVMAEAEPDFAPAAAAPRVRRFIWSADPAGVFESVSSAFAEAVDPDPTAVAGRHWDDLAGTVVDDPAGEVAAGFRERRSWTGVPVTWHGPSGAVAVVLSGMPVFGGSGYLYGFRGFGLCRPITEPPPMPVAPPDEAVAVAGDLPPPATSIPSDPPIASNAPVAPDPPIPSDPPVASDPPAAAADPPAPAETALPSASTAAPGFAAGSVFGELHALIGAQFGATRAAPPPDTPAVEVARAPEEEGGRGDPGPGEPVSAGPPTTLSFTERGALREIARALGARLDTAAELDEAAVLRAPADIVTLPVPRPRPVDVEALLDRLPVGITVLRDDAPVFANRHLLDLAGYPDLAAFAAAGGARALFGEAGAGEPPFPSRATTIRTSGGEALTVEARLARVDWFEGPAALLLLTRAERSAAQPAPPVAEPVSADPVSAGPPGLDLEAALDLADVAILLADGEGRLVWLNGPAERLFGYGTDEVAGETATALFAPESHAELHALLRDPGPDDGGATVKGEVRLFAWPRQGEALSLAVRVRRTGQSRDARVHIVLRRPDEGRGGNEALREAEETSARQTEFLARVSHEIRTPVNAIIGFAEMMLAERFGPVENERYRGYLADIRDSGGHVVSLVSDLLDLSRATAGQQGMSFAPLDLRAAVTQAVSILQPAAAKERIVVRTSFAPDLPRVVADERSVRQIALNLMSNAIKFTPAGGQVIVSAALNDGGGLALRVRDTGIGMSESEVEAALQPFRQLPTSRRDDGIGLGLPVSKALAEANGASFTLTSRRSEGTLVEIVFPPGRVLAE